MKTALLAGAAILAGCGGTTYPMTADRSVPFAVGEVDATVEKDGTGRFQIDVEHLGDPGKLDPAAKAYVVWVKPRNEGAKVQNVGAIEVGRRYTGRHTFTSTFKEFDVKITPEPSADAVTPTGQDVLKARIDLVQP